MVFMVEAAERCLLACMKVSAALLLQIRGETKLKMVGPLVASWREQKKLQNHHEDLAATFNRSW
jgi:hypothetical protein